MNRITLTIHLDLPEGVQATPDITYGSRPAAPSGPTPAAVPPPPAAGAWACPEHGTSKVVPAGVSQKTGKPYNAFTACGEQGCDQKPPRGQSPSQPPPLPQGGEQFDDLPFDR
jgi:hypothetical protein